MKRMSNRLLLFIALSLASVVGVFRGNEAKQKWMFRVRSRLDEKKQVAEQKKLLKEGGILLDDIEIAAFHNN